MPLPTGTVTFLFSDIEGSTTLWEQAPEAMRSLLAWHDGVLRSAIESSHGQVIKTTGDGLYAVFGTARDAVAACLEAQRSLQTPAAGTGPMAIKVRMGLHSGAAEPRDGDYFGTSPNRAARIMSVAHGEQVLLSSTTAELVKGDLPEGVALREMGDHRLRGLAKPERLLQLVASGLRAEFPPLASQAGHSLPAERDAFVDRVDTLAELAQRMRGDARLVSILGIGGTGKTRLVTRFGWSALDTFPGGVWFCDLSEARTADGVLHAVAQGLDVPLGSDDPTIRIGNAIAGRGQCLVILDNFEQVARHAEATLGRWLSRAGMARFLATTREVLGLPGEQILALGPLPVPDAGVLFMKRAEAAKPGLAPNAEDQAAIDPLVKLLEGLPLAIELAAARVRVMPPRTLLARMSDRFRLLTSTGGRLDRQATLRAVFDWSWDLLSPAEKAALAQLSVFEGGFTLEAAEAVLDLAAYDAASWPIDVLQSLVQKSLVRQISDERFDLLVSVQEYAAEHLRTKDRYAGSGPEAVLAAESRHGAYFAALDELAVIEKAGVELDNLVAACRRAVARGDAAVAAGALQRAWAVFALRGPFQAGVELASIVGAIPALPLGAAAIVRWVSGRALALMGKVADGRSALESSLEAAREAGDRAVEARVLTGLGALDTAVGRAASAQQYLERGLLVAKEIGDRSLEGRAHLWIGNLQSYLGNLGEASLSYETALGLARQARDRRLEASALGNLGTMEVSGAAKARSWAKAALAVARDAGDRVVEGNTLCNLGLVDYLEEKLDDAREHLEMAWVVGQEVGNVELVGVVLCNLGLVADAQGNLDDAESKFNGALAIARDMQHRRSEGQILGYLGLLWARRGKFAEAKERLDAGEVLLRAVSDPVSHGILLCNRGEAAQLAGSPADAKAALSAAETIAAEASVALDSELGVAITRLRRLLQA
jgi:predicted ATPase/class 3 adenylate cyclase